MKTLAFPPAKTSPGRVPARHEGHSRPSAERRPAPQTPDKNPSTEPLLAAAPPRATPKLFYRIQEAAELTGLKPSVLRYWESEFRELHPDKDASDQRRYRQADIEVVQAIRKLLYEDRYTIKGARGRLREELRRMRQESGEAAAGARIVAVKAGAPAAPPLRISQPSLTEFRTQPTARDEQRKRRLNQSLKNLRSEVSELLGMLS